LVNECNDILKFFGLILSWLLQALFCQKEKHVTSGIVQKGSIIVRITISFGSRYSLQALTAFCFVILSVAKNLCGETKCGSGLCASIGAIVGYRI
jgi:hypothetical protein